MGYPIDPIDCRPSRNSYFPRLAPESSYSNILDDAKLVPD
jgi:hypothetical protein